MERNGLRFYNFRSKKGLKSLRRKKVFVGSFLVDFAFVKEQSRFWLVPEEVLRTVWAFALCILGELVGVTGG